MSEANYPFPKRPAASELRTGRQVIGVLTETGVDQPWIHCSFTPGPHWAEVSWIFSGMLQEVAAGFPGDHQAAMTRYRELELELHPIGEGDVITPAIIWIEGDSARYRY